MDTDELVAEFITSCRARRLAKKTVRRYQDALAFLPRPRLPTMPGEIDYLLTELRDMDLAPASVHSHFAVWRTFYFWVALRYDDDDVAKWVARVDAPRRGRKLPRFFSRAEVRRIAEACETDRDRALLQLALDTGARVGEVASLRKANIMEGDYDAVVALNSGDGDMPGCEHCRSIRDGRQEAGKSGERLVPVSPATAEMLLALGDSHHIWLSEKQDAGDRDALVLRLYAQGRGATAISRTLRAFGHSPITEAGVRKIIDRRGQRRRKPQPLGYSGVMQAYRKMIAAAGISGERVGPHTLRHTFATEFLRRGGSLPALQRIMGHSKLSTTQIYLHLGTDDLQREHRSAAPTAGLWNIAAD